MTTLETIYRSSLSLLTDLYQLTMAYGYWKLGRHDQRACFNLSFRRHPFGGGYTIAAGLEYVLDFLKAAAFDRDDLAYLASLTGNDDKPLFAPAFLDYLGSMPWRLDVDAMPEGTAAFPLEPLLRVTGPILQCQLVETPLLNLINFQTLIATKSARICQAARGEPVVEFGLRRAQGIDGALAASRAAYIGGCAGTSNVLAGRLFGIPVKGTHAHSWVMSFADEAASFEAYADAMPNNCIFLVDTYDTLQGVRNAAAVGRAMRDQGHEMIGIRLDSGDLAYLSVEARKILDEAGLTGAAIVASNDLDEHLIDTLKDQGAAINLWGVGTRLVTGHDQPALGGVYKLSAVQDENGFWQPRLKLSEQAIKISVPGLLQVRRFRDGDRLIADMIYDELLGEPADDVIVDPGDATRRKQLPREADACDLLIPVVRDGREVGGRDSLDTIRARVGRELEALHPGIRRLVNPHTYPAGLALSLHTQRQRMTLEARGFGTGEPA